MPLKETLEQSFETYAGMTIKERAICDVRDMLKPGARMSMYAQYIDKITPNNPYKKSQKSVASAMDHFYVHGDLSLYPLFARMGKPFAMRYVLEDFQGNTGTIECGDNEAASRYTEMRLAPLAMNLFTNIEKSTISEWNESYSGEEEYPSVLPSVGFYNIVNGTSGIATAIASSVPQFNLKEVNEAMIKLLWDPTIKFDDIYCAPDFCTGAILLNAKEVKESLEKGTGFACKLRSVIEYDSKDRCIIVKEIPYSVYTETIRDQLMEIIESDENPGIERFLDQSTTKPCIKIYIGKKSNPDKIIKYLFKNTSLQYHYPINMIMLDNGRKPKVFGWREALLSHIEHEKVVYINSFKYDLKKIEERLHIIEGLLKAIDQIDEVIATIKKSADSKAASKALQTLLKIDEIQAKAILDIKLSKLAHLEVNKLIEEQNKLNDEKIRITNILNTPDLLKKEIENGFRAIIAKYSDARRTKIIDLELLNDEEPTEIKQLQVSLTNRNSIFCTETSSLYVQKRGGVGNKFKMDSGEYIISTRTINNNEELLLFTDNGNVYHTSPNNIPFDEKTYLTSLIGLKDYENVRAMTASSKKNINQYIIFITKKGIIKKSDMSEYNINRNTSLKALALDEGDEIIDVLFTIDENIGILSEEGNFIIINSNDIRATGRVTRGVRAIKLNDSDNVVASHLIPKDTKYIASISGAGLFKKTNMSEFTVQGRDTKGSKLQKLVDADFMADFTPLNADTDILVASTKACIKLTTQDIPLLSKGAQGNKSIKLTTTDSVIKILAY